MFLESTVYHFISKTQKQSRPEVCKIHLGSKETDKASHSRELSLQQCLQTNAERESEKNIAQVRGFVILITA